MGEGPGGRGEGPPMIFHCATSACNPITWRFMLQAMPPYYQRHPSPQALGPVFFRWVSSQGAFEVLHKVLHEAPAAAMDLVARLRGRSPFMRRQVQRLAGALSALSYFTHHQWRFDTSNASLIHRALPLSHHPFLAFDFQGIIWDVYFTVWSHGMKVYLLKEAPNYGGMGRSKL